MASANLTGYTGGHASYPPELISMTKLGYVKEHSGVQYSRDVGRTSAFAHTQFFIFGDTFCWDGQGQFVGVQSNTASIINAPVPIETTYPSIQPNGLVDPLIPLTEHEKRLEKEENVRVTLWPFGGIVETQPGWGWAWFEKGVVHSPDGRNEPCGIGIAQIRMDQSSGNVIRVNRGPGLIFEKEEPRFGGFSSCLEGNYIYLWGHHDNNILLARVRRDRPIARSHYEYWNGREYVKNWELAVPVLQDVQQGAVVKSTLFGPDLPWVFVGCTRFADSKVMMGAAARLEGPWELTAVCQASGIDYPNGYMYCMYPHVWAFEEEKGELMVTWSEPYPGNVIAAKLKLKMGMPLFL
ncbi:hypothetical protein MMC20_002203 [Loxospora ochrophaea]|nr:hypothetical protein [Loxospora ochrophaea]